MQKRRLLGRTQEAALLIYWDTYSSARTHPRSSSLKTTGPYRPRFVSGLHRETVFLLRRAGT
jgi:hypothetical protein